ncbi:hypothetical protein ACBR55_12120 [Salinicoccus roseus]|uniref:hypothetical protein n=1 Tax=Salinicoccus roseus TaxID=45670 RepID=UPI003525B386
MKYARHYRINGKYEKLKKKSTRKAIRLYTGRADGEAHAHHPRLLFRFDFHDRPPKEMPSILDGIFDMIVISINWEG